MPDRTRPDDKKPSEEKPGKFHYNPVGMAGSKSPHRRGNREGRSRRIHGRSARQISTYPCQAEIGLKPVRSRQLTFATNVASKAAP